MVFESAVSQVLNQFLGDFVENLDGNQLNIGIWGGDVELKNLVLKPSALDDLDLPIQTVYGTIGKLVLKIPWKSLYTSPTVVLVENVYLLAQPLQQVKYDPNKEDKKLLENKRKEIEKVEAKKKAELEKDKPKADPGFVQKLTQQIIKNIQLHITNIHIRYEDEVTSPGTPFALGVTLSRLNVESTDSNWKKAITEDVSKIYKIVDLEGLGIYWNCGTKMYGKINRVDMLQKMKQEIATKDSKPQGYTYVIGPINASARLRMNPKPEDDELPFTIPINHLNLDMGKLFIGITKLQYRDIIAFADSMDRMTKGIPYRKYRPNVVGYKGHYKEWWHFAYKCILEGEVRRKKQNWEWAHMLKHRKMCKEYGDLYKKQLKKQCKEHDLKKIETCERKLDLVNIVIIRQRIELETERLIKKKGEENKGGGWLEWMGFSGKDPSKESLEDESNSLLKQFEKEMTQGEKDRLYQAIDYHENTTPTEYPKRFVDNSFTFLLRTLQIELKDDNVTILKTNLQSVKLKFETRVAASSIKVYMQISNFVTTGLLQDDYLPEIISSDDAKQGKALLEVLFETNPVDETCDQRIRVTAQPLKIVYDALTINKVIDIFKIPQDTSLDQIQAAAGSGFMNVKEMTATGLVYAIEKHVRIDLNVDFHAPYVVIPYGGKYEENSNVLVLNLGQLKLYSEQSKGKAFEIQKQVSLGVSQSEIFSQLVDRSYDNFHLKISDIQVLVAQGEEDWRSVIKSADYSDMHILNPLNLHLKYSKCVVTDDPRLPLHKVTGKLPNVSLTVSEARLLLLVALGTSIPLPVTDEPTMNEPLNNTKKSQSNYGSQAVLTKLQEQAKGTQQKLASVPLPADSSRKEFVQFTMVEASFVMEEFSIKLNLQESIESKISELAYFSINNLEASLIQKTYETHIKLKLRSIDLNQTRFDSKIEIISTPICSRDKDQVLFGVVFTQVDKNNPELHSTYGSCETSLALNFAQLSVILHQQGLLDLMKFANDIQDNIDSITVSSNMPRSSISGRELARSMSQLSNIIEEKHKEVRKKKRHSHVVVETIKFKLKSVIDEVSVKFATDDFDISTVAIRGINAEVLVKDKHTQIRAKLQELCVVDLYEATKHNLILQGTEGTALDSTVVINNIKSNEESQTPDMVVTICLGGSRIVFLNRYVCSMLNFMNQFQAAQQALKEASEEAARRARENVKDAYEKATKIALNINLKAPLIVVPVNSLSNNVILIDLGTILLENKFNTLNFTNKEGFSAVVDDLDVTLSNLKVSRGEITPKNEITNECIILNPLNFTINVKRNLSSSWYKEIPDIYVSGKIKVINLMLSQEDYRMIMATLSGNLGEGKMDEETSKVSVNSSADESNDQERKSQVEAALIEPISTLKDVQTHIFFKFVFAMEQLIVNLYTGGSTAPSPTKGSPSRQIPREHLGRFSLEGLSVKGRITTDQSMVTSVLLLNCLLDDMRKGREDKLTRLIHRTVTPEDENSEYPRSMIDVTYQQKPGDMFVDVRIYSFTLILSVEYLMKIADFFSNLEEKKPVDSSGAGKSITSIKSASLGTKASKHSNTSDTDNKKPEDVQMTLNLKLEKPDIILVEHMDNIDTNAMILNSEICVKLRMSGSHQVMSGNIKDLQLYTCNYNPKYRADTRGNVLHPLTISLAGSTPESQGLHLELIVTDVLLNVSPATIELLNRVLVTMSSSPETSEETEEEPFNFLAIWDQKAYNEDDYWYLKTDSALEASELSSINTVSNKVTLQELCIVTIPSIVVTVEAGVSNKTLPMLMLEMSLKGTAKNWSSQLNVEGSLTVQMGYYNSFLALWEPLIEPVDGNPWELKLDMSKNDEETVLMATSPQSEDMTEITPPTPVISIDINSDKNLEMTVTKTCLEVLQNLGKAFSEAISSDKIATSSQEVMSPYKVLNEIGEDVTLLLETSSFDRFEAESIEDINKNAAVHLQLKPQYAKDSKISLSKVLAVSSQVNDRFLNIKINKYNCELSLPVVRADKRFFMLNFRGDTNDNYGIISDVKVEEGVTVITLRSIIQVHNHFNQNVEVYFMTQTGCELELIGTVESKGTLNLPLKAVYSTTSQIFFAVKDYSVTCQSFVWKELLMNPTVTTILKCPMKDETLGLKPFMIKVIGEIEQVYYENTSRHTMASTCYNIHLRPAVIFKNWLPVNVVVCVEESVVELEVGAGDTLHLPNIDPGQSVVVIRLPDYLEKEWSCRQETLLDPPEFSVWTFNSYDSALKMSLCLGMHSLVENGSLVLSLYCPFWMLNKTGMMLGYRSDNENVNVMHHPADFKGPIMFSFNAKNFFGKKKTSIRIESGEWSDKFSIDVAGSSGVVSCKANDKKYQIGVHNQLTYNSLTKQVTFTPYYVIINEAPFSIECQEADRPADPWIEVEPKSCAALWPQSQLTDKLLRLRVVGTDQISERFLYTESHTTLLKLNNKYGGVNVDIQLTEGAVYINLTSYSDGCAPALIINHTNINLNFWEKESVQIRLLKPKHCQFYTWENPSGPRLLVWEKSHKKEIENDLRKDDCGSYYDANDHEIYWASFLDGMQRVLLFTDIKELAEGARASTLFEVINQEISVSMLGVGLSLVNNITRHEILYIGIASSGIIWESCKMNSKRFKQLNPKESTHLEHAYQCYLFKANGNSDEIVNSREIIDNKMEVDFKTMQMYKPTRKKLQRTYQTGLWLHMKTSPSQMQLHAKINRLQIDNQMFDCTFPVLLAPVAPPKSVAIDSGIKPFVEVSIVQLLMKNSQIRQFKYFKVLVQEFHVKVDLGFINALLDLFAQTQSSEEQEKQLFLTDLHLVEEALYSHAASQSIQEQKSFYDLLHFSPLKIHVSFSMTAGSSSSSATPNFLNVLLQGVGVTLTDIQDVVFKLAFFERDYTFLTQRQLTSEATTHYVGQLVKQLYVLVLGLDVIGNPYGLVVGIGQGFEDLFYEPFQGAIQGPSEFAEGLALGVKSLFGHTVGGAVGAVSRITGAMGKGIAALTFDEEFQRKRRDQINKKPSTVQEGIARSGKGLVMGVFDGVTGVFTKPISGAKEQGVEGFFKGLGKGAVGLVTRPAAGVVDFASGSLDVVKRATEVSEDTLRLRAPRFLQADGLVKPYSRLEADGHKLLMELSKGKYAKTDIYVYHYVVIQKKEILLLTDKRLAFVVHNDIFGGWQIEWSYTWQELQNPAKVVDKGVYIPTSFGQKKKLFGSNDNGKLILVPDPKTKEDLCFKIESLRSA